VAAAPGAGGTLWRSTLSLANETSDDAVVSAAFMRWRDTQPSKLAQLTIAHGQTRFFSNLLQQLFEVEGSGSLALGSNVPLTAWTRTSMTAAPSARSDNSSAFGANELMGERGAILQGISENDASRTNAGFVNAGTVRVDVTVRCFGTNGTPLVTKVYSVEPGQTVVAGRILADLQVAPVANVYLLVIPVGAERALCVGVHRRKQFLGSDVHPSARPALRCHPERSEGGP
jgi:hypothetical protein